MKFNIGDKIIRCDNIPPIIKATIVKYYGDPAYHSLMSYVVKYIHKDGNFIIKKSEIENYYKIDISIIRNKKIDEILDEI